MKLIIVAILVIHIFESKRFSHIRKHSKTGMSEMKKFMTSFQIQDSDTIPKGYAGIVKNGVSFSFVTEPSENKQQIAAEGFFHKVIDKVGWDKLSIVTYETVNPYQQAFLAGYIEARLTADDIFNFYSNIKENQFKHGDSFQNIIDFYSKVDKELDKRLEKNEKEKVMRQYLIFYCQLKGLEIGYNKHMQLSNQKQKAISTAEFFILQADGEIPELKRAFSGIKSKLNSDIRDKSYFKQNFGIDSNNPNEIWRKLMWQSRCSAFVKLITGKDGKQDIMVGHNTWSDYYELLRSYKHYQFAFLGKDKHYSSSAATFSSYPGTISSTDDFYITSHGLVITETTIEVIDVNLYKNIKNETEYIPNFMRVMAATFFTKTANDWVEYFRKHNSGTYSSQWIIIDYTNFEQIRNGKTKDVKKTVYVLEQTPNNVVNHDISEYFFKHKFFGGYNRAFFDQTKHSLHESLIEHVYGEKLISSGSSRAVIFKNMEKKINTLQDMQHIIRYNGYKKKHFDNDPSHQDAGSGISSRFDSGGSFGSNLSGGIDGKVTNFELVKKMTALAISGPTHEKNKHLKPFSWKNMENSPQHLGNPETFKFPWIVVSPKTLQTNKHVNPKKFYRKY